MAAVVLVGALPDAARAVTPPQPPLPAGVEDLQPYLGQAGCDPVAKPGVLAFQSLLMSTYRDTGSLGIVRDCGIGGQSEHKEGRAFDWAVSVNNPSHVAEVKALIDWLTAYDGPDFASKARRFGIMYMIWNQRIWKSYQPNDGWQPYSGASPHTDHVHFSFGWNGANKATSWWTGKVAPLSYGPYSSERPPAPTPPPPPNGPNRSPIDVKYAQLGGERGLLGPPTGSEVAVLGGRYRPYVNGAIYSGENTGVHEVHGAIAARYLAMGGSRSPLGLPTSDEVNVSGGRGNSFSGGSVLWSGGTGARAVYGAIGARYRALNGPDGVLGLPTSDEVDVPGGRALTFQGGAVLWSGTTGAHEVYGMIDGKYDELRGAEGPLGLPLSGEVGVTAGRANVFQGGNIYWSGATGAHTLLGAIKSKFLAVGGTAVLGLPVTDELDAGPGARTSTFTAGRIYWSGVTGAHRVYGYIGNRYVQDGAVAAYGLPLGDEYPTSLGRTQDFQRAALDFDAVTQLVTVRPR
ncbi:MAG TPA: hypothetical protein VFR07_03165 [Mycobacteriales bacterium]|nr:hypothetical protein [Mycobacteriales bacterium]